MTADRYARLRECVEKATPGEWECRIAYESDDGPVDPHTYKAPGYYNNGGVYSPSANAWPVACDEYNIFETPDDWAYIAAASPATIRELLQERDLLAREVEVLRHYGNKDCTHMADKALEIERAGGEAAMAGEPVRAALSAGEEGR